MCERGRSECVRCKVCGSVLACMIGIQHGLPVGALLPPPPPPKRGLVEAVRGCWKTKMEPGGIGGQRGHWVLKGILLEAEGLSTLQTCLYLSPARPGFSPFLLFILALC